MNKDKLNNDISTREKFGSEGESEREMGNNEQTTQGEKIEIVGVKFLDWVLIATSSSEYAAVDVSVAAAFHLQLHPQ